MLGELLECLVLRVTWKHIEYLKVFRVWRAKGPLRHVAPKPPPRPVVVGLHGGQHVLREPPARGGPYGVEQVLTCTDGPKGPDSRHLTFGQNFFEVF